MPRAIGKGSIGFGLVDGCCVVRTKQSLGRLRPADVLVPETTCLPEPEFVEALRDAP